ncbi:MAG TPA: penicillin acylase family protein [Anaerolineales bacterium]|nr:penicillin acylase family protein [Anaerolineales bacterium]
MPARFTKPILALLATVLVVSLLAISLGPLPALGPLLSPLGGFWSAAKDDSFRSREQLSLAGLHDPVTVVRDVYGIPHIFAQNDEDAAFAVGYLQAKERLAQMDLQRRNAEGTMAALVGADALKDDEFMRDVGLERAARASLDQMKADDASLLAMQAYANGVNAYIHSIEPDDLPLEYKLLGVRQVEDWSVLDEMTFAKYMGWDLVHSFDDLYFTTLVEKMGAQKVYDLFPIDRPIETPFVPSWPANETPLTSRAPSPQLDLGIASILDRAGQAGQLNPPNAWHGSNNWAISGSRSATGRPILASDPHLGYQLPSLWYAVQIVTPTQNVEGVTLAGIPFVVIGHTRNIAWGLTNTQADVMDFFTEKINPDHPDQYWHDNQWNQMQVVDEVIEVAGGQAVHYPVRITDHGPILSKQGFSVAMQWTGALPSFEARALYNLNHSEDYPSFVKALQDFKTPAQNFAYADTKGNIAIWSAGLYPIRKSGDGRTIADGSSGEYDWTGYIPFDQVPHALNPQQGFLESANERPAGANYPYYLGYQWDPNSRATRIRQRLAQCDPCTVADMEALQYDSKDVYAEAILPTMIAAVTPADELESAALQQMKSWNYFTTTDSIAATIWVNWLINFRHATWQDDWQAAGFQFNPDGTLKDWDAWGFNGDNEYQPPFEVFEYMVLHQPNSPYFDDLATKDKVETRDDIIRLSFEKTLSDLKQKYGPDLTAWQYGKNHVSDIPHLLDVPVLNRTGIPIPGDGNSPNGQSNGGPSDGGPSWRMVVDFSNIANSFGVYPGGQSGSPISPEYDNFIPLWAQGEYFPLLFPAAPDQIEAQDTAGTVTFEPK